jgi:hypothetical protein
MARMKRRPACNVMELLLVRRKCNWRIQPPISQRPQPKWRPQTNQGKIALRLSSLAKVESRALIVVRPPAAGAKALASPIVLNRGPSVGSIRAPGERCALTGLPRTTPRARLWTAFALTPRPPQRLGHWADGRPAAVRCLIARSDDYRLPFLDPCSLVAMQRTRRHTKSGF